MGAPMLSITTPSANSTVTMPFIVSGTCTPGHTVAVKVIEPQSGTFHHASPQASEGTWEATFYDIPAGVYNITAICGDMREPIEVDSITVE